MSHMYKIFNGNITQTNTGTLEGKLFNTFNCDLTYNKGKMSIAPRTILTTDTITNMGVPIGFKLFDTKWFTIAGSRIFYNNGTAKGVFTEDSSPSVPTNCDSTLSDLEVFGDDLVVTATDKLYVKPTASGSGGGTYVVKRTFASSPTGSPAHMLCVYNNRCYWVDTRGQILSMDTSYTVASAAASYTFKVPNGLDVTWMRPHSTGIYIGTLDPNSGNSYVYSWNGVTADTWIARYAIATQGILAGHVDANGTLYVITAEATLMQFTGSGFIERGRLPIKRNALYKANGLISNNRFIHPNGFTSIDGVISMLINNRENSTDNVSYLENIHSGIWEYTPENGLYHKYSLSYKTSSNAITDYGQMNIYYAGGLANVPDLFTTSDTSKGNFLAGAGYYTTSAVDSGLGYGIWTDNYYDDVKKAGFFSTQQIRSSHVKDMWNTITALYDPTNDTEFVVKYRTEKPDYADFDITWISQKSFTTTESSISQGDEITIIQGKGSGRVAHVLSEPTESGGTYTVVLDEDIETVSGTARARRENWNKLKKINKVNQKFEQRDINHPDTLIELKVAMVATGEATIDEIILDNKQQQ